jgi:predicted porin
VSYALLDNLSLTASYAYMHDNVKQDIRLNATDQTYWDNHVPYKTTSRNYSFDINYSPKSFISLNGGISHTKSQGTFYTSAPALDSIASYSELKIRETTYTAAGEYRFKGDLTAGVQYRYTTFNDVLDNIYDDVNDGRASIILLTLSKKW